MKKLINLKIIIIFAVVLLWTMDYGLSTATAAVPRLINYQARLTDNEGQPLDGRHDITFGIYNVADEGAALWIESWPDLDIEKGIVSVMLGDKTSLNLDFNEEYYLQISVDGEVMDPRQRITSVGYAFKAESANTAAQAVNAATVAGYSVSEKETAVANKIPLMGVKGYLPDASVDTTALKTGIGAVSGAGSRCTFVTLPGGSYGFYPQVRGSTASVQVGATMGVYPNYVQTPGVEYITRAFIHVNSTGTGYLQQRYITASGLDYWLFVLTDKQTKGIISVWGAADHPAYGNGGDFEKLPHPFNDFDETTQEISLICKDSISELKQSITKERGMVDLANEEYRVDFSQALEYQPLHSGQFLGGKPVLVETIPDYITVRKLTKLTLAEKRAKEVEAEQSVQAYEEKKEQEEQQRQAALGKLEALGLTEEDIKLIMQK